MLAATILILIYHRSARDGGEVGILAVLTVSRVGQTELEHIFLQFYSP